MKQLTLIVMSLVLTGLIIGCATLSKDECLQADWYEIGYRDGSRGTPRSLFQKHFDACLEHSIQADRESYFKGREDGLSSFCTYDSGFSQGSAGKSYHHVCAPELESEFMAGYRKGIEVFEYNSQVASLENRLRNIENQIQQKESQLVSTGLDYKAREKIRAEIRHLDLEYRDAVRELRHLEKTKPIVQ